METDAVYSTLDAGSDERVRPSAGGPRLERLSVWKPPPGPAEGPSCKTLNSYQLPGRCSVSRVRPWPVTRLWRVAPIQIAQFIKRHEKTFSSEDFINNLDFQSTCSSHCVCVCVAFSLTAGLKLLNTAATQKHWMRKHYKHSWSLVWRQGVGEWDLRITLPTGHHDGSADSAIMLTYWTHSRVTTIIHMPRKSPTELFLSAVETYSLLCKHSGHVAARLIAE